MVNTADTPVMFNPLEEGFVAWPYDQYARLREHDPVHRSELLHGWVLTRYDDVATLLRDPSISVQIDNATPTPLTEGEIERREDMTGDGGGTTIVLTDEPDHGRLRKLLATPFSPRHVEALRPMIRRQVDEQLEAVRERTGGGGELDLIADFAYPLPVTIFCEMLGIPDEDHPQFRYWTQCVARALDPLISDEERDECTAGTEAMRDYLELAVEEKRKAPADDLMSELIQAEEDGDSLTTQELQAQILTLYVAGHEPTAGLVGNAMLGLLRQRDQLELLQSDRGLLQNAVLELLRYDGPNQFVRRITMQPTVVGETEIPAGAVVYASPGAANHDPAKWGDDAEALDIERADAKDHMQFGAGIHKCLGGHLARVQAEEFFSGILDRLADIELAGEPEWSERMVIRGLNKLPISCTVS